MKIDLKISGMTCMDCSRHITKALDRLDGVSSAMVDYRAGHATVETAHEVAPDALVAAVERAGYTAAIPDGRRPAEKPRAPERATAMAHPSGGAADFDLLIIGTGGAGVAAAIQAVGMGGKVGIAEGGTLGGTCVNVGCIPSKNLIEAAAHYRAARQGFQGVAPCEPAFDWREIVRQKDNLVGELRKAKYADVLASYPGIAILEGHATLVAGSAGALRVRVGTREHTARKLLIATGTAPSAPPIPGLAESGALDSTSVMELPELPKSMLVLGGSAVGLELGQTFARFGVKVTVVELMPRLLPNEDEAIATALRSHLEAEGIEIHTGVSTTRVERSDGAAIVHVREGSLEGELRAEQLLVATGRRPNTHDIGLEAAGVELTARGFVRVDTTMRTSHPDIYAAGDVTGGPGYVYVAAAGGRVAAENAMQGLSPASIESAEPRELDLSVVPNVTFTSPQVGSVGLTEARAREQGHNVQVASLPMEHVPRALVSRDTRGVVKVVSDAASGKLLGVHAVTPFAGELMGEAALAIRFGLTARDLAGTLHPYLTWAESLKLAAQGFGMDVSKLSCCA